MASCRAASVLGSTGIHLSAWTAARVVEVGADVDLLDAGPGPECEMRLAYWPVKPQGVVSSSQPQLSTMSAVLGDVFDEVGRRRHHALEALAPDVLGAPVPAFPAVRVADLLGEAAHHVEQAGLVAVGGMDGLALAVAVALGQDGERAVFLVDAPDLGGDDVGRLVPGDPRYLLLPRFCGLRSPLGSQSTRIMGNLIRLGEKVRFL